MLNADDAAALIRSHSTVAVTNFCAEPLTLTAALWRRAAELRDVTILSGMMVSGYPFLSIPNTPFRLRTWFMPGALLGMGGSDIPADFVPLSWGQVGPYLAKAACDVALIQVSPADRDGYHSLGISVAHTRALFESTRLIIAEVNEGMPRTMGDSLVHESQIGVLVPAAYALPAFPHRPGDAIDSRIGRAVADLVPDGSTLQFGIGTIPGEVVGGLQARGARDLSIVAILTDPAMDLIRSGACRAAGPQAAVGELLGSAELYRWCDANPAIRMASVAETHSLRGFAGFDRLVSVNSALEVDLYGQVNSEFVNGRQVGGMGGSIDFSMAAQGEGALSIIALRSSTSGGISRIVERLNVPAVTIPRALTQIVVTEHGVADLRGRSVRERARLLADIADPAARDALRHRAASL